MFLMGGYILRLRGVDDYQTSWRWILPYWKTDSLLPPVLVLPDTLNVWLWGDTQDPSLRSLRRKKYLSAQEMVPVRLSNEKPMYNMAGKYMRPPKWKTCMMHWSERSLKYGSLILTEQETPWIGTCNRGPSLQILTTIPCLAHGLFTARSWYSPMVYGAEVGAD